MSEDKPCPFCGSSDIHLQPRSGAYDCDKIVCESCHLEFTYYPPHIASVWNTRAETDGEHCPLCGGEVEFDGLMNFSSFFVDAYCPTCGVRFEFQGTKRLEPKTDDPKKLERTKQRNAERARKAFARREAGK